MAAPIHEAADGSYRVEVMRPKMRLEDSAKAFESSPAKPLEAWADKKGRQLGAEIVLELEQGRGGGIRSEWPCALLRVGLTSNEDGTSTISN